MKIIHEISAYLHAEGFVSDEMMVQLRAQGFVPHPSESDELYVIEPEEHEFEHECPRDRMPLRPSPKLATLSARVLDARLAERLVSWRELATLRSFVAFLPGASRVKSERDLEAIYGVLHRSTPRQKLDAMVASVRARKPDLGELFSLLKFRGYRDVLVAADARGPAVNAYVAAIASVGRGEVGTYGWVLKRPAVRAVFHLVEAQREVARVLADLVSHHSELLPTAIRRSLSIYWPLVLLHSARLYDPKRPFELPGRGRHHPRRASPSRTGWADAWTLAMQIDELSTRAFLESLVGSQHWDGPAPEPRFSSNRRGDMGLLGGTLNNDKLTPFACPPAWDLPAMDTPIRNTETITLSQARSLIRAMAHEQSLLLLSPPGMGKSDTVAAVAEEAGLPCRSLLGTQIAPEDVSGVPRIVGERSVFCPPRVLLPESDEPFCLFLDELPASTPDVQKAFYSLLLERRLGEFRLPKGTWVVAAGNRVEDRALVRALSSALLNRVFVMQLRVDVKEWLAWAVSHRVRSEITSYIAMMPEALLRPPPAEPVPFSTPRAWASLSRALDLVESAGQSSSAIRRALAFGRVSAPDAAIFCAIEEASIRSLLPSIEYLENPSYLPAEDTARWFVLSQMRESAIAGRLDGVSSEVINRFLLTLPHEHRFAMMVDAVSVWGRLGASPAMLQSLVEVTGIAA